VDVWNNGKMKIVYNLPTSRYKL